MDLEGWHWRRRDFWGVGPDSEPGWKDRAAADVARSKARRLKRRAQADSATRTGGSGSGDGDGGGEEEGGDGDDGSTFRFASVSGFRAATAIDRTPFDPRKVKPSTPHPFRPKAKPSTPHAFRPKVKPSTPHAFRPKAKPSIPHAFRPKAKPSTPHAFRPNHRHRTPFDPRPNHRHRTSLPQGMCLWGLASSMLRRKMSSKTRRRVGRRFHV
jgi:hypothetical protein